MEVDLFPSNVRSYPMNSIVSQVHKNSSLLWPTLESDQYQSRKGEPSRSEILLQLGVLYWRRGDLDRSERLLVKAGEIAEESRDIKFLAQCFIGLALVKNSLKKTDEAIAAFEYAGQYVPENFHIWNNLGKLYTKTGKYDQALKAYRTAIKIQPDELLAWIGLANACYQRGYTDEALKTYERVVAFVERGDVSLGNDLVALAWLRLADIYTQKSKYQKAILAYRKLLSVEDSNADVWKRIGELYIKIDIIELALSAFSKAIEIDPACGDTYLKMATLYTRIGKHFESIPFYMKSIEWLSDPNDLKLAVTLIENARRIVMKEQSRFEQQGAREIELDSSPYKEATWFYYKYNEEVVSISLSSPTCKADERTKGEKEMPNILPLSFGKFNQSRKNGRFASLKDEESESVNPLVWNEKGNIHFKNKAYEEAIDAYNKAIELDPDFGHPYNNLALIQFAKGNFGEAILLYQQSIRLLNSRQEKAIAWNGLGNAYRRIKDYESARIAYQNASELDPKNGGVYDSTITYEASEKYKTAEFWNDLGKLFFKAGVYDKAASAFQEAIQLEPTSGQTYGHLARALTAQGKYQEAVSLYHKSIDLISNNADKANVWNRLGDVHRKLNDYDNALQAYQNGTALANNNLNLLNRARFSLLSNCTVKH